MRYSQTLQSQKRFVKRCATESVADGKKGVGLSDNFSLSEDFMRTRPRFAGATAVEYGIMAVAVAAVIIALVTGVGEKTNNAFQKVNNAMNY